jgi:hypothetical protein
VRDLTGVTYANQQRGKGGSHRQPEDERDNLGRALRIRAENVVNLGLFAVTQGLFVGGGRRVGILLNLDLENRSVKALRSAEGGEDDGCLKRLGRDAQLDGEFLLRLWGEYQ